MRNDVYGHNGNFLYTEEIDDIPPYVQPVTPQDETDALLVDMAYSIALLELGVM